MPVWVFSVLLKWISAPMDRLVSLSRNRIPC
jgi:hypothetical protein